MSAGKSNPLITGADAEIAPAASNLSARNALEFVSRLAHQVGVLHKEGRLQLNLRFESLSWNDEGEPVLPLAAESMEFGGPLSDEEICPPALWTPRVLKIPGNLRSARRVLGEAGVSLPPEAIDLHQLGALLCRFVTGQPLSAYLRSPKTKSEVPPNLQTVLDRAIGQDLDNSFQTPAEFAAALLAELSADPAKNDSPKSEAEDTAPSVLNPQPEGDTSLAKGNKKQSRRDDDSIPFDRLGHFEILERIGHGGMGDVYKGYERLLDRTVAIKVLPSDLSRSDEFVHRFYAEATSAARLVHSNIIQIYFIGEDRGCHFFAMQYVDGESLADRLKVRGNLNLDETLEIIEQALAGLSAAHERGLVHRDIKPGNILLEAKSKRAYLADFGLVKSLQESEGLTATGMVMGTVDYISPEQGRGLPVDARADLYSLGVVLYRMLSGRLPFEANSPTAMIFQHVYESPPRLDHVSAQIAAIVDKLLSKSPEDRYQDAAEVLADLAAARQGKPLRFASVSIPEAGQASDARRSQTLIIEAPPFDEEPIDPEVSDLSLKQSLWDRMMSFVGRRVPQFVDYLENTSQQFDRAIAKYDRRRAELDWLIQSAEAVQKELQELFQACRLQAEQHDPERTAHAALANEARELNAQVIAQQNQLEEMRLQHARVSAKAEQLRSQRNVLNARLKAAQAKAQAAGGKLKRPETRPRLFRIGVSHWKIILTASAGVVLCAVLWIAFQVQQPVSDSIEPRGKTASERKAASAAGQLNLFKGVPLPVKPTRIAVCPTRSDSGLTIAVGLDDGQVELYKAIVSSGEFHKSTLTGHSSPITCAASTRDGKYLATGDDSGSIRIWNIHQPGNKEYRILPGTAQSVRQLIFSRDASQLLALTHGGTDTARLWDIKRTRELETFSHPKLFSAVPFAWTLANRRAIVSPGLLSVDAIGLWPYGGTGPSVGFSQHALEEIDHNPEKSVTEAVRMQYSGDSLRMWDPDTSENVQTFGAGVRYAALTEDRRIALFALRDHSLSLWNLQEGREFAKIPSEGNRIEAMALSPNELYAVVGTDLRRGRYALRVIAMPAFPPPAGQVHRMDVGVPVEAVKFSPDGFSVAVGSQTGLTQWPFGSRRGRYEMPIENPVTALAYTTGTNYLIFGTGMPNSESNFLGIRSLNPLDRQRFVPTSYDMRKFPGHKAEIKSAVLMDGNSTLISGSRDGTIRFWNVEEGTETASLEAGSPVNALAISPDETLLLAATDDETLRVYDAKSREEIRRLAGHQVGILDVRWSPDGSHFVTAGGDRVVRVWKRETMSTTAILEGHRDRVNAIATVQWGRYVVSGSDDGTVRLWNTVTQKQIADFEGHTGPVFSVDVDTYMKHVVSGSADGTARIWKLEFND